MNLDSCPFCKGEAEIYITNHVPTGKDYTPRCKTPSCAGRLVKKYSSYERAVFAWNRPRGHWTDKPTGKYGQMQSYCSICGRHSGIGGIESNRHKPFCPNCGNPMEVVKG